MANRVPLKSFNARESVRSLERGLAILRHVNSVGEARPSQVASALRIPRPTVYRLLATLEEQGYIIFSSSASRVRVTRLAASLGDGYAITSTLCQVAGRVFATYSKRVVWPLDVCVYNNAAMVVQETTHGRSPLSIDRGMMGYRLPMLRTSAGRAYLSFCNEAERELILSHVRSLADPEDALFLVPKTLTKMLSDTVRAGVATRLHGEFRSKTSSIAAPVIVDGKVEACISVIWISKAISSQKALQTLGGPLRQIALEVAEDLSQALQQSN